MAVNCDPSRKPVFSGTGTRSAKMRAPDAFALQSGGPAGLSVRPPGLFQRPSMADTAASRWLPSTRLQKTPPGHLTGFPAARPHQHVSALARRRQFQCRPSPRAGDAGAAEQRPNDDPAVSDQVDTDPTAIGPSSDPTRTGRPASPNRKGPAAPTCDRACSPVSEPADQAALSPPSSSASSPLSYISIMMSDPPTNSPFTYSCGMVGQSE